MRCSVVCLRLLQFTGTEFRLAAGAARPSWLGHWMCATIVSVYFILYTSYQVVVDELYNFISSSVTLYAEFLPTKQRAKCVVLLDVSMPIPNENDLCSICWDKNVFLFIFVICSVSGRLEHALKLHSLSPLHRTLVGDGYSDYRLHLYSFLRA